jgi:hypothetical protein
VFGAGGDSAKVVEAERRSASRGRDVVEGLLVADVGNVGGLGN